MSQHQQIKCRYRGHEIIVRAYRNWHPVRGTLYVGTASGFGGAVWSRSYNFPAAIFTLTDTIDEIGVSPELI